MKLLANFCLRQPIGHALLMILIGSATLCAQSVGTTHVIPIVADGAVGDGTIYITSFLITRMDTEPTNTCTLEAKGGLPAARISETSIDLTGKIGERIFTTTAGDLATGFAVLSCTAPVTVSALYVLTQLPAGPVSLATVLSQGTFRKASLTAFHQPPVTRLGIAVANNSSVTANYTIQVEAAGTVVQTNLTLAPQSSMSKFLDEILTVPNDFFIVTIISDQPIAATGLLYLNNKFTTIPLSIVE
jgi:hypothetical protein